MKLQTTLLKKSLNNTFLHNELISIGAFVGDHLKWTHFSQESFVMGYRNKYSFYNMQASINLLIRAARFLKIASKKKVKFVFVGNPTGSNTKSALIFRDINLKFFPNEKWSSGFLSKKKPGCHYVLIIYNIKLNNIAFREAVTSNIPVVGFATPACDIRGVDYPIVLNLKNNDIWYANFCKALFIK